MLSGFGKIDHPSKWWRDLCGSEGGSAHGFGFDPGIDLGGRDARVAEKLLHGADVASAESITH